MSVDASATAPSPSHAQTPAHVARASRLSRHVTPRSVSAVAPEGGRTSAQIARIQVRVARVSCPGQRSDKRSPGVTLFTFFKCCAPIPIRGKAYQGSAGTAPARFRRPPGALIEEVTPSPVGRGDAESGNRHTVLVYPPGKPTRAVAVGRHTRLCTIRPSVLSVIPSARLNAWPGKAAHRRPAPCWNSQTARRARNRGRSCASRYGRS